MVEEKKAPAKKADKLYQVALADGRSAQEHAPSVEAAMEQAAEHNAQPALNAVELDAEGKPVVEDE